MPRHRLMKKIEKRRKARVKKGLFFLRPSPTGLIRVALTAGRDMWRIFSSCLVWSTLGMLLLQMFVFFTLTNFPFLQSADTALAFTQPRLVDAPSLPCDEPSAVTQDLNHECVRQSKQPHVLVYLSRFSPPAFHWNSRLQDVPVAVPRIFPCVLPRKLLPSPAEDAPFMS